MITEYFSNVFRLVCESMIKDAFVILKIVELNVNSLHKCMHRFEILLHPVMCNRINEQKVFKILRNVKLI